MVGRGRVVAYKDREMQNRRRLLLLEMPLRREAESGRFQDARG